ncbi:spore germination protein [Paenibacillus sp. ACRRX]|uniref:GerAB/ArcD/ProY family transporter n=1 Tax=Paenibacillus sp. ACRRX TaxID=2918206 RepID=UPI001EF658EE|nr:GerAB/ArcD/ProY family transporter [Paenibacillus sp. ACRRX]MCG7407297.1 spore germination protein [Paenibacillus sp. ACRRX]
MDITIRPKPHYMFQAYMLIFMVLNSQIGVGIFGFQRYIYRESGHDAWVSVLVAALFCHGSAWLIVSVLRRYESTDLYGIHRDVFGKWIGGFLSVLLMIHFSSITITIIRTYIEAVQSWIFPSFPTWLMVLMMLSLALYGGAGGIRVIVGMSLISFVIIFLIASLYYYPLRYAQWTRLLPFLEASPSQILAGAKHMGFTMTGFEVIYFLYPFVRDKPKTMRNIQISIAISSVLLILVMVISIVYFSENQLLKGTWSSINMQKIVKYPFIERLEFVTLALWMITLIPTIMLITWITSNGLNRLFGFRQYRMRYVISGFIFICSILFVNRGQIDKLNDYISESAVIFSFAYPLFIYVAILIKSSLDKNRASSKEEV